MRVFFAYFLLLLLSSASLLAEVHKWDAGHEVCLEDSAHFCPSHQHHCLLCESYLSDVEEPQCMRLQAVTTFFVSLETKPAEAALWRWFDQDRGRDPPLN